MTTTLKEPTMDELVSQVKSMKELLEKASQPQYAGQRMRFNDNDGVVSYWTPEDRDYVPSVIHQSKEMVKRKSLPKGYKGAHNEDAGFNSISTFLQTGLLDAGHKQADWNARYKSIFKGIQGMSVTVGSDGGYLLPPEWADGILERVYSNNIYGRTDNYTVGTAAMKFRHNAETSRKHGKRNGGLQSFWVGEGQTATASHPKMRMVDLYCKKLVVIVYLTEELIKDSAGAAERWIDRMVGNEFDFMLGDAIFNGNGVQQPLGVLKSPNRVVVSKAGAAAGVINADIIDRMWARRAVSGAGQYNWFHNQDCGPQLDKLEQGVGTGGVALYRPDGTIANAPYQSLKGAPRIETEFNETVGAEGDLALVDLSKYLTISTGGITQASSVHVEFLSDQTALKFTMRVDGQPLEVSPIEPFKGVNLQSSTIVCENRN